MSEYSIAKSHASSASSKQRPLKSIFDYMQKEENPFAFPPDEKIFTFKEEEKQRRADDREKNMSLKIWEKNRPIREGCLRKLCETDIEPSALAINTKVQKKIN